MEAYVFSIEEFSTYDGPGIRTTVFLKGCPLRCQWCHNPEGQRFENQILKAQSGCIGCGACLRAGEGKLTEASISVCPNRLLRFCGTAYTPESLVSKLERNISILNSTGGGVTFSGGEPLAQPEFLLECLTRLRGKTHRALQTSGYASGAVFGKLLPELEYVLFDLKLMDGEQHRKYTGVSNEKILRNFDALCESGVEFVVRTPLIPGVTDTAENLTAIARHLKARGIGSIELLPYNQFAGGKYAAVEMEFHPDYDEKLPSQPRLEIFEALGIQAKVM